MGLLPQGVVWPMASHAQSSSTVFRHLWIARALCSAARHRQLGMQGKGAYGIGVAKEVNDAIFKAIRFAVLGAINIPLYRGHTVYYPSKTKFIRTKISIFPRPSDFGISASPIVMQACELLGIRDITVKVRPDSISRRQQHSVQRLQGMLLWCTEPRSFADAQLSQHPECRQGAFPGSGKHAHGSRGRRSKGSLSPGAGLSEVVPQRVHVARLQLCQHAAKSKDPVPIVER